MKKAMKSVLIVIAACLVEGAGLAVDDLQISVQDTDVVLEWPSQAGQSFLITYRSAYETNATWSWLSTNWPAASGTNRTVFVHTNGAYCSGGGGAAMMMAGGSSGTGTSGTSDKGSSEEWPTWLQELTNYEFPKLPWSTKAQEIVAKTYPGILPMLPWSAKE